MEEIKEAIIGRPGLYCNGVRQFTGYVSDMGNLPNLYYPDEQGVAQKVTRVNPVGFDAIEGEGGLAEALKNGHSPQPWALWRKTEAMAEWKYHEDAQLWAGWKGPYIEPPAGGALRDAWGHKFLFVVGEVMGYEDKTFRCKESYTSTATQPLRPGSNKWEVIEEDAEMNFRIWQDVGTEDVRFKTKQEQFYGASCLTIISLGKNGMPGGEGLDQDISIVIEPTEYMGEVAGNVGDLGGNNLFADKVCLYYPNYTEGGGDIDELCILPLMDNTSLVEGENGNFASTGINFRFGKVPAIKFEWKWSCSCGWGAGDNCYCEQYKDGYHCYIKNEDGVDKYPDPNYPPLSLCVGVYDNFKGACGDLLSKDPCSCQALGKHLDYPDSCADVCVEAGCTEEVACSGLDRWLEEPSITCEPSEDPICVKWICDEENADCDCDKEKIQKEYDDPNWVKRNIPIGIRSIKAIKIAAEERNYMFSVCPGGNWIGTVRGGK